MSLPQFAVTSLTRLKAAQRKLKFAAGTKWVESGLVFTSSIGTALDERNVRREFEAILKQANLSPMRIHDLRHTCASLFLAQGAGAGWVDSGFVFTSPIGTALEQRNVTRQFHELLVAADLPPVRFHDLRHTAATLLLAQGVDPRTIVETLGHSHVLSSLQEEAAAKMNAILSR